MKGKDNLTDNNEAKNLYIGVALFVYMLLICNVKNSALSLVAVGGCLMLINVPEYLLPHMYITSLFGDYFVAFAGIGMSRVITIIFIIAVLIKRAKIDVRLFFISMFLGGYCFISCMFSSAGITKQFFVLILNIGVLLMMYAIRIVNYTTILRLMRIVVLIMAAYMFLMIITGNAVYLYKRLIWDYSLNSNSLGMAVAQMIVMLLAISFNKEIVQRPIVSYFAIIIMFYILLLTGSRTALLSAVAAVCVTFLYLGMTNRIHGKSMLYVIAPVIILIVLFYVIQNANIAVLKRLTIAAVVETGGTGRTDIWLAAMTNIFPQHPIFGIGFGGNNVLNALYGIVSKNVGIHNMYISLLVQVGIVGAAGFLGVFFCHFYKIVKSIKLDIRMILPAMMLLAGFINGFGEEVFNERFMWMALGLYYLIHNLKQVGEAPR